MSAGNHPNKSELIWEVDTNILLDVLENPRLPEICFKKILGCNIAVNEITHQEFIKKLEDKGYLNNKAKEKANEVIESLDGTLITDDRRSLYDEGGQEFKNHLDGRLPDPNDVRILSFCNQYNHGIITRDRRMENFAENQLNINTINPIDNPKTKQYYETR